MRHLEALFGATLALFASGLALAQVGAQVVDGLDLSRAQKRGEAAEADARAFATAVQSRGDALADEARAAVAEGETNLARTSAHAKDDPSAAVDLDAMVRGIGGANEAGRAPQLIAFVSLSMPIQSLKPLIADVARAGGVVVFQGFPQGSVKLFTAGLARVVENNSESSAIGVDPRLFRAFGIRAVPAIVTVSSDFDLCDGFHCTSELPPYDVIAGNVTLRHALETFTDGHGPGARIAAHALAKLGPDPRDGGL